VGDKIRIDRYEENYQAIGSYYDTVFVDTVAETAKAYCLKEDSILCKGWEQGKDMPYEEFVIKLPHEYIEEIEQATKVGSETLYDRRTYKLTYRVEGMLHTAWVDEYSGIPLRVQIGESRDSPKWEFREVGVNGVLPEDVVPPQ
jgi:hypothetical protein